MIQVKQNHVKKCKNVTNWKDGIHFHFLFLEWQRFSSLENASFSILKLRNNTCNVSTQYVQATIIFSLKYTYHGNLPANTRRLTNAGSMLFQRRRRWLIIEPELVERLVFGGLKLLAVS